MVKNSKYLFIAMLLCACLSAKGQMSEKLYNPIQRDLEISRVTLENYLKNWDGAPLLNRINQVDSEYDEGIGIKFSIEAPYANIIMINQGGRFQEGDDEIMETFYTDEIKALQKERLDTALNHFINDFKTYLPTINPNQVLEFSFKVGTGDKNESTVKLIDSYEMLRRWGINDLESFKKEEITTEEFINRVKRNNEQ